MSRRTVLAGLALSLTATALPRRAAALTAAEAAPDGFHVLRARAGLAALRGEGRPPTPIWGYDGIAPGPLLRLARGKELKARLVNALQQPTTIHWHGLRLPNAMDGVPRLTQPPVAPNASFDYRFTPPDAGTFWYHAYSSSPEQVGRGLYGPLIVDDAEPADVDGDVMLVVGDWPLDADGAIVPQGRIADAAQAGRPGDLFTVNGRPALDIPVRANGRLRLRLLNATNARLFALRVERHRPVVMAIDGQPAEPYAARDARVVLGPGNRIDLFVDATLPAGSAASLMLDAGQGETPIGRLVYAADAPARPAPRETYPPLPANPLPERMDFARALKLDLPLDASATRTATTRRPPGGGDPRQRIWAISGEIGTAPEAPALFSVPRGRTVMLAFSNPSAFPHSMHLHGHHFRLLDALDDGWKPFWLDSAVILPNQTARIAFVADNPGKWVISCQKLEYRSSNIAAWFDVT